MAFLEKAEVAEAETELVMEVVALMKESAQAHIRLIISRKLFISGPRRRELYVRTGKKENI